MIYSTNKVQVSYMTIGEQYGHQHFVEVPRSNFPHYKNSLTLAFFPTFH